jgi:hypothetical protein
MFIPPIYVEGKSSIEMLTILFYIKINKQEHEEFYTSQLTYIHKLMLRESLDKIIEPGR